MKSIWGWIVVIVIVGIVFLKASGQKVVKGGKTTITNGPQETAGLISAGSSAFDNAIVSLEGGNPAAKVG